jgi:hypothetical protein
MGEPLAIKEAWQEARPEIISGWRDILVWLNVFFAIAVFQGGILGLRLLHVDEDLLGMLEFGHKWSTVGLAYAFLFTVVLRGGLVAFKAGSSVKAAASVKVKTDDQV